MPTSPVNPCPGDAHHVIQITPKSASIRHAKAVISMSFRDSRSTIIVARQSDKCELRDTLISNIYGEMHKIATPRALKAIKIPSETLCPFLYQTRTISNQYAPRSSTTRRSRPDEDSTLTFLQRKARDVEARRSRESTLTARERQTFINIMKNFGARIDGLALPSELMSPEPSRSSKVPTTNDEPTQALGTPMETPHTRATNRDINNILSIFAPIETNQQFSTFSADTIGDDMDSDAAKVTPQDTRKAAMESLRHISHNLQIALSSSTIPPDVAVWRVLETDVFPLITLLQTSNMPSTQNPYTRTISSVSQEHLPPSITTLKPETPLLPLVTILYPAATLLALRTYIAHLSSSGYALALLPKIRSLGPASYLLAGNTQFFNALLYLHWTVYSDLRTIYQLLGEMKRSGIEYDQGTFHQIEEMRRQRNADIRGEEGLGSGASGRSRTWWTMRMQEDGWRGVMRKYKFDMLGGQQRDTKRKGAEVEGDEMDHEIM